MICGTVSSRSCFYWLYRAFPSLTATSIISLILVLVHVVTSMCRMVSCVVGKRAFAMTSAFSWQNSVNLCPTSFCTPRPNLPVTPGISWLSPFVFQSPMMKKDTPVLLPWEPHEQYEKAKRYDTGKWAPPGQKVSNMLLEKSRWHLLITPDRMMQLGQSKNNTQLWICLMVKVKSDAIKNNIV